MRIIGQNKILKEDIVRRNKQVDEFELLFKELKHKYNEKEICIKNASNLSGSLKGCKVLMIRGDIGTIKLKDVTDTDKIELIYMQEGIKSIGHCCFSCYKNLKHVYLPKTLMYIGDCAFEKCVSLVEMNYDGTEDLIILENAFEGCYSLEKVSINCEHCTIYKEAFYDCENLKSVKIKGKAFICAYAFWKCGKLQCIEIDNLSEIMKLGGRFEKYVYDDYDKLKQKKYEEREV